MEGKLVLNVSIFPPVLDAAIAAKLSWAGVEGRLNRLLDCNLYEAKKFDKLRDGIFNCAFLFSIASKDWPTIDK